MAKDGCEFCELLKDGILDTYTRRNQRTSNLTRMLEMSHSKKTPVPMRARSQNVMPIPPTPGIDWTMASTY